MAKNDRLVIEAEKDRKGVYVIKSGIYEGLEVYAPNKKEVTDIMLLQHTYLDYKNDGKLSIKSEEDEKDKARQSVNYIDKKGKLSFPKLKDEDLEQIITNSIVNECVKYLVANTSRCFGLDDSEVEYLLIKHSFGFLPQKFLKNDDLMGLLKQDFTKAINDKISDRAAAQKDMDDEDIYSQCINEYKQQVCKLIDKLTNHAKGLDAKVEDYKEFSADKDLSQEDAKAIEEFNERNVANPQADENGKVAYQKKVDENARIINNQDQL